MWAFDEFSLGGDLDSSLWGLVAPGVALLCAIIVCAGIYQTWPTILTVLPGRELVAVGRLRFVLGGDPERRRKFLADLEAMVRPHGLSVAFPVQGIAEVKNVSAKVMDELKQLDRPQDVVLRMDLSHSRLIVRKKKNHLKLVKRR